MYFKNCQKWINDNRQKVITLGIKVRGKKSMFLPFC